LHYNPKLKHLAIVSFELVILFISTSLVCYSNSDFIIMTKSESIGNHDCPEFFLDEPILYAHWTIGDYRLLVVNNSNYQELTTIGIETLSHEPRKLLLKHNDFILTLRSESHFEETPKDFIEIIDVRDLVNPELISEVQLPTTYQIQTDSIHSLGLVTLNSCDYLFLHSEDESNYLCINISNVNVPTLVESYQFPLEVENYYNEFQRFYIKDNLLFIPTKNASSLIGFVVYNVTTLTSFTKVSEWFGNTNLTTVDSLVVSEDLLFLKNEHDKIEVFDIQNMTQPKREGYIKLNYSLGSYFRGNYLITINLTELFIIDFSNITDPIIASSFDYDLFETTIIDHRIFDDNKITDTHIYLPFALARYKNETLFIFDWTDPYNMLLKAGLGFPNPPTKRFPNISRGFLIIVMVSIVVIVRIKYKRKISS